MNFRDLSNKDKFITLFELCNILFSLKELQGNHNYQYFHFSEINWENIISISQLNNKM